MSSVSEDESAGLRTVDRLEVQVLVDNVSDLLSSVPAGVTPELPNLIRAGMDAPLSGECMCCAHWGLSLVITAHSGETRHTVLFDSGPEGYTIGRNGNRLGISFGDIDAVVLSHGHWDHSGGMIAAIKLIHDANGGTRVPYHVNADMFVTRALKFADGRVVPFKDIPSPAEIDEAGGQVVSRSEAHLLLDDTFYLSGEIPRVTSYEKGLPGHLRRSAGSAEWEPDPWIMDERFLAVSVRDKGVIVFTACSHAGVINVLSHARDVMEPAALYGVMGGFHLSGAACEKIIPETVEDLKAFGLRSIIAGHCTGWRAVHALVKAFGEEIVVPSAVGRRHAF